MAASALAIAAQLTPLAISATEAVVKSTILAQQVKSANLLNKTQWIAIWDMADTQFITGYNDVMNSVAPSTSTAAAPTNVVDVTAPQTQTTNTSGASAP